MKSFPRTLHIAPEVFDQVEDQSVYYRKHFAAENIITRWEANVLSAIRSLRTMPLRGAPCAFRHPFLKDLRRLPIEGFPNHLLFYRFYTDTNTVSVLGVSQASRDLEATLVRILPSGQ